MALKITENQHHGISIKIFEILNMFDDLEISVSPSRTRISSINLGYVLDVCVEYLLMNRGILLHFGRSILGILAHLARSNLGIFEIMNNYGTSRKINLLNL